MECSSQQDYPRYPGTCDAGDEEIQTYVKQHILQAYALLGDDPPSPSHSVDNANNSYFVKRAGKVKLHKYNSVEVEIKKVSRLPFWDLVLRLDGNKQLNSEAVAYMNKFTEFIKTTNVVFEGGRFQCPGSIAGITGSACRIKADRPCPLYYYASQSALRASTVEPINIPGREDGHVLVHLEPTAPPIPAEYLRQIVYAGTATNSATDLELQVAEIWVAFVNTDGPVSIFKAKRNILTGGEQLYTAARCGPDFVFEAIRHEESLNTTPNCDCGKCSVFKVRDCVMESVNGTVMGELRQIAEVSTSEEKLMDEANDSLYTISRCLDLFPANLSVDQLGTMCQVSTAVAVAALCVLGAQGHVRAQKVSYAALRRDLTSECGFDKRQAPRAELFAKSRDLAALVSIYEKRHFSKVSGEELFFYYDGGRAAHVSTERTTVQGTLCTLPSLHDTVGKVA